MSGMSQQPSITCPKCGMTSYNPDDIEEGYCGHCCEFTSPGRKPMDCEICGKPDADKPMAFRGERWCSDDHRKVVSRHDDLAGLLYGPGIVDAAEVKRQVLG